MILRLLTINLDHRALSSGIGVVRLIVFVKHVDVFVLAVVFAHLLIGVVDIFITRDCRLGLVALLDSFFLRFQRFVSLTPEKQSSDHLDFTAHSGKVEGGLAVKEASDNASSCIDKCLDDLWS